MKIRQGLRFAVVAWCAVSLAGCSGAKSAGPPPQTAASYGDGVDPARKMIWNASLALEVPKEKDVEPAVERARAVATDLGGYVSGESTGSLVLRVPNARLTDALNALERLGEVADKHVTGDDVTADYRDLEVRIENAKRFQERLRELAAKSASVEELLEVEKEQARVTTELERLEAQLRTMQSRTTLATVHVSIAKKVRPGPVGWVFYGAFRAVKWLFVWD